MGNIMSSEQESDDKSSEHQMKVDRETFLQYQAYKKKQEQQFIQEQQHGVHRNAIAHQQNTMNNIGQHNTFNANMPMHHQIPEHIPTQFINRPQPSNTKTGNSTNHSYDQNRSHDQINNRLYRENIKRNYDRPLVPKVQSNKPVVSDAYTQSSQLNASNNSSNNVLSALRNINTQQPQQSQQPQPQPQQPQQQSIQINKEILEKIDPFGVLTKEKLSIPQLRQKYKKLSLIHHPDRGGTIDNFNILNKAIKSIDTLIKYHTQKQTHSSLKNNFKHSIEQTQKTTNIKMGKKFSIDRFNKIYDTNRIQTRDDEGYASLMDARTDIRDDITVQPMGSGKITKESFNNHFNQYKQEKLGELEVHTESLPEPTTLERELMYKELGESRNNFTNSNQGYTDFKQAHIDNTLVNTNVNYTQFNSVKDLEHARSTNLTLTEKDKRLIQQQKDIRAQNEQYRQQTLEQNDRLMYDQFKKMNATLL